jgi:hypothetical protein
MSNQSNVAVRSLSDLATSSAISAVAGSESAFYKAAVALSVVMVSGQIDRLTGDLAIDVKKNKSMFRAFLKSYAYKGNVVWRGSEAAVEEIKGKIGAGAKRDAASTYIDKKPKGSRLVDGLARLQTMSTQIADDVCEKHTGLIREIHQLKADGADAVAQIERFQRHVAETYGKSAAAVQAYFAKPQREGTTEAPIKRVTDAALKLSDVDLATLLENVRAEIARRKEEQDVADSFLDEATEEPTTAPALLPAPVAAAA